MNHNFLFRSPLPGGLLEVSSSSASWESGILRAPAPFSNIVASWNAGLAPGARLRAEVQVLSGGQWSPWFSMGSEDGEGFHSPAAQEGAFGKVDVDTLSLPRAAEALSLRVLVAGGKGRSLVRLAALAVSDGQPPAEPSPFSPGPWVRELKLRGRSQMEEQEKFRRNICSPTSLAMVMDFFGARRKTTDAAAAVQDRSTGQYGVWPSNTAYAGKEGLEAFVARLDSLRSIEEEIAAGRPVVISIGFGEGELAGAPLGKTRGHLLAVVGFTPEGDVIALDPAASASAQTRRVYRRRELHRAWRENKAGLAYLISKPLERPFYVSRPTADLRENPSAKAMLLTQLVYGERVRVLRTRTEWAQIQAEDQLTRAAGAWRGYPGWIKADALVSWIGPAPDAVVRSRRAQARAEGGGLSLSMGTRVRRLGRKGKSETVLLLDGRAAEIDAEDLAAPGPPRREDILEAAERFLGTLYVWGGRSGAQENPEAGVDCSGLVSLAYRASGVDVPRDAMDQKLKSRPIPRRELAPADLIFLTESARSKKVTHVMIYAGKGGIVESRMNAGKAVRTDFSERFGVPLERIESGDAVLDRTYAKPRKRVISFGSFLK